MRLGPGRAALLILLIPALAAAEEKAKELDPVEIDERVEELFEEWKELKTNQDVKQQRRRREISDELGRLPSASARRALLSILQNDRDIRTQIRAMIALGNVADLDAVKQMVRFAIKESRTVLPDYLGLALARVKDPSVGPWLVETTLDHGNKFIKISTVEALGELRTEEARAPLLEMLRKLEARKRKKREIHLYYEILRSLGRIGGDGVREALMKAARDEDWRVRLAPAEVLLLHHRDREALEMARKLLRDDKAIVRELCAITVGEKKIEPLFPELVVLMREGNLRAKQKAYEALRSISEKDFGYAPDVWDKWWRDRKRGKLDEEEDFPKGETVSVGTYYDFKIFSDRVLFVVDVSGSMQWPNYEMNRIYVARKELVKAVRSLDEKTLFNLMTFAGHVNIWNKRGEVPATKENIEKALEWIDDRLKPRGATNTYEALERAFELNPRIDTIFFLSDGLPSTGRYELPEQILIKLRYKNRFRRVIINTIALVIGKPSIEKAEKYEDPDEMADFMRMVAEWNGGHCVDLRKPPSSFR